MSSKEMIKQWKSTKAFANAGGWTMLANAMNPQKWGTKCPVCGKKIKLLR